MDTLGRLLERFWFVPTAICVVAAVAAEVLVAVDERLGVLPLPAWAETFVYRVGESGSRDLLGAIATSALAVAGTTFSITVAVLALTSSSYGPRLVRNFMADKVNQAVLGIFVATFLYALLVLRSVRAIGDPGDPDAEVFVPHLAVNGAVLLAVLDVTVLVYFIHHIADSIQVTTISRRVQNDLRATVERLYPEELGVDEQAVTERPRLPAGLETDGGRVTAGRAGYVSYVQDDDLMAAAREHDVLLALQVHPGRYVLGDGDVCLVHPAERLTEKLADRVRDAVGITDGRSPHQDVGFAVQQLTELAVRALSPGTNDPYTAINAIDDLSVGLSMLAGRRMPSPARLDDDHVLRVHAPYEDATALTGEVLGTLRWYATGSPAVMHAALTLAERVGGRARDDELRARLSREVSLLDEAFRRAGHQDHDVEAYAERAGRVRAALATGR